MKNILRNVESIRQEKRIKQEVVARALGIKQPAYSNFINRDSDPSYDWLLQVSNSLGVSVVDIITYPEKWVPESSIKHCAECTEKDKVIKSLNNYIEILEKKLNINKKI